MAIAAALAAPLVGLVVVLVAPRLDVVWEHHPAHFWLVLVAAAINVALAAVTGEAARRRADARLFLVSLTFLAAAGFLGLHALATPGVLLDAPNTGFVVATPVGLLAAALFAAASSVELSAEASARLMRWAGLVRLALVAAMVAWGVASLGGAGPLERPLAPDEAEERVYALAVPGIALYALAAFRYLGLLRRRGGPLLLAIVAAFVLLAEAMVAVALGRSWHASWWEWHVLMLFAFGLIAWTARREWRQERFAPVYLEATAGSVRDVSVVFADLEGFSSYSEREGAEAAAAVVDAYLERIVPAVAPLECDHQTAGDEVMLTFNARGDQPDHALRAVRAALRLQREAATLGRAHPEWPRFRAGVNTGPAQVGVVGGEYKQLGETVNTAKRLEGWAPAGEVVVGEATYRALPDGTEVRPLGGVRVKGKEAAVDAYVVLTLPGERDDGLRRDREEPEHDSRAG